MATEIRLRHPETGDEQVAYEGYSWTSLSFGAFPTLLRGDIDLGLAVLFATVVLGYSAFAAGYPTWFTTAIVGGTWGKFYNKIHLDRLRRKGYQRVAAPPRVHS